MWTQNIFPILSNSAYLTRLVERQTDRQSNAFQHSKRERVGNNSELSRHHNVTLLLLHIRLRNKIALVTIVSAGPCWTSWTMLNNAGPGWTMLFADMEFVQNFTLLDFQVKNFTPSISLNFNSFSKKKHKKWVKMEKFTPLAKILHCRRRQWRHGQIPPLRWKQRSHQKN